MVVGVTPVSTRSGNGTSVHGSSNYAVVHGSNGDTAGQPRPLDGHRHGPRSASATGAAGSFTETGSSRQELDRVLLAIRLSPGSFSATFDPGDASIVTRGAEWPTSSLRSTARSAAACSSRRSSPRSAHSARRASRGAAVRPGGRRLRPGDRLCPRVAGVGHAAVADAAAATQGMAFGLWPISWIVLSAVFFYNLSVASGDFDVIRRSLARATGDRRFRSSWSPSVSARSSRALPGSAPGRHHRIDAGWPRLRANHRRDPGPHRQHDARGVGSLGIPITTLGGLLAPMLGHDVQTDDESALGDGGTSARAVLDHHSGLSRCLVRGLEAMVEVWPAVVSAGLSFALGQFVVSNYVGPELTASLSALFSLASMIAAAEGLPPGRRVRRGPRTPEFVRATPF